MRLPNTTGLDAPGPGSSDFQAMFSSGLHLSGSPLAALTPCPSGPRNAGQSFAAAATFGAAAFLVGCFFLADATRSAGSAHCAGWEPRAAIRVSSVQLANFRAMLHVAARCVVAIQVPP